MESFFSRNRNALVLIAVLVTQVIGLAVQVRAPGQSAGDRGGVRLIRAWVVGVVSPPERLLHGTGLGIRGIWSNYFDLVHVRQQNKNLQQQLDQLRLEEASLAEDARQDLRLQAMLGFQQKYIYKTVAAQVIGTAGTEQSYVLFIDKGSSDGVAPDMPVITPDGIVGKTRDVFDHTSQVLEISDATSGAGVILQQTRIQGVLRGSNWGEPEIVNVSPDERIKAGEPVVTSGGDSIYPRGLAVGNVDRVVPDPDGTLVSVLVKPAANLSKLEEVLIITSTGTQMPAQMQDDVTEAQQKASDILAERLPSRTDPNAPAQPATGQNGAPAGGLDNALPTPPPKPPPPLHADHYSPSTVPPAEDLVPGQRLTSSENQTAGQPAAGNAGNAPPSGGHAAASGPADATHGKAPTKGTVSAGTAQARPGSGTAALTAPGKTGAGSPEAPRPKTGAAQPAAEPGTHAPAGTKPSGTQPAGAGTPSGNAPKSPPPQSASPQTTTPPQNPTPPATQPQGRN